MIKIIILDYFYGCIGWLYWMAILALVGNFKSHNRGPLIIKSLIIIKNNDLIVRVKSPQMEHFSVFLSFFLK
jgi:hypothetical protein